MGFWIVLAARLVQMATAFVALRVMTELLGPTELGRFAIIISVTTFFALVFINPAGMYVNRRLHSWNSSATLRRHLAKYAFYVFAIAIVACVTIPVFESIAEPGWPIDVGWLVGLVAGSVFVTTMNQTIIPSLNLLERRRSWLVFSTLSLWLALGFSALFSWRNPRAESWQLGQLTGFAIGTLLAAPFFLKNLNQVPCAKDESESAKKILSFALPLALSVGLYWCQFQSYRLVIGKWISFEVLGGFMGVYTLVAGLMAAFENLMQQYLYPKLYSEGSSSDPLVQAAAWRRYAILALPMIFMACWTLLATYPALIHLFLAPTFHIYVDFALVAILVESVRACGSVFGMAGQIAYRTQTLLLPQLIGVMSLILLTPYHLSQPTEPIPLALLKALGVPAFLYYAASSMVTRFKLKMRIPVRTLVPCLLGGAAWFAIFYSWPTFGEDRTSDFLLILIGGGTFAILSLWVLYNWRRYQKPAGEDLRVVHIMRAPFGGIRLHVQLLMENPKIQQWLVTDVSEEDAVFAELRKNPEFASRIISLSIPEAPGLSDVVAMAKIYLKLRKIRPHVLHGHGAKGGLYARMLADPLFAKAIYGAHGGSLHKVFSAGKQRLYRAVERLLAAKTDTVIFESEYTRERYFEDVNLEPARGHLVSNGLHLPQKITREEKSSGRYVLGAFGQLRTMKGQDILIRATKLLITKGLDVEVRIFGDGPQRVEFEALISDLSLETRVRLMGDVPNAIERMKDCDLVIQPSRFESFGYTAVEAMAVGVPVVASAVGGLKGVITDGIDGLLVDPQTPEAFADRIEFALGNPRLRSRLVESARKKVEENYDAEKMKSKVFDVYRLAVSL